MFSDVLAGGVLSYRDKGNADMPTGHFNANYKKLINRGLASIRQEAQEKLDKDTAKKEAKAAAKADAEEKKKMASQVRYIGRPLTVD